MTKQKQFSLFFFQPTSSFLTYSRKMRSTFATLTVAVLLTVSAIANAAPTKDFSSSGASTSLVGRSNPLSGTPVSDVVGKAHGLGVGSLLGGPTKSSDGSGSSDGSSGGSSGSSNGSSSGSSSGSSGSSSGPEKIEPNKKCGSNSGPGYSDGDDCNEHQRDHDETN